jgi:phospholipid-binding lipoprotein MlaA
MTKMPHRIAMLCLCLLLVAGTAGCGRSLDPKLGYKTSIRDPIEPVNRGIFAFNNLLDIAIIEPVAKVYNFLVPSFARDGVQNFMRNLNTPIIVANEFLQGDIKGVGVAAARFVINTTAGMGGLFDVAGTQGLPYSQEDFGQTLAVWGFGDGFYMVLPVIGPSSLRDTAGIAADSYADPVRLWAHNTDREWIYYTRVGLDGLDKRARLVKATEDLRRNSLDYYAAVRSAYVQKRQSLIRDANSGSASIPDYDEPAATTN